MPGNYGTLQTSTPPSSLCLARPPRLHPPSRLSLSFSSSMLPSLPPPAPPPPPPMFVPPLPRTPLPIVKSSKRLHELGEALAVLHRRFSGKKECRAAFMRVAGLAGGDIAPGMLEEVVVEMLSLPVVSKKMENLA